jgi:hypothetical protein
MGQVCEEASAALRFCLELSSRLLWLCSCCADASVPPPSVLQVPGVQPHRQPHPLDAAAQLHCAHTPQRIEWLLGECADSWAHDTLDGMPPCPLPAVLSSLIPDAASLAAVYKSVGVALGMDPAR